MNVSEYSLFVKRNLTFTAKNAVFKAFFMFFAINFQSLVFPVFIPSDNLVA